MKNILLTIILVISGAITISANAASGGAVHTVITTPSQLSNYLGSCTEGTSEIAVLQNSTWQGNGRTLRCVNGLWQLQNGGDSPIEAAARTKGTLVQFGDSNTFGRPGWAINYNQEWFSKDAIFEGWTNWNIGQNGSILSDWANAEIANADNPTYSSLPPVDSYAVNADPGAGRLARGLNANPTLIIICLGTNDENSPSSRAGIGLEANLKINLNRLVNFLLIRTNAAIVLRMPQPFEPTDFLGVTQWVNAAEAQEASRRIRATYQSWIGRHSRVMVYDSHTLLFGNSCDNKAVNAQDPILGAGHPLIGDSLHPTDLGYRRIQQQIAQMLRPNYPRNLAFNLVPSDIPRNATWSATYYLRSTAPNAATSWLTEVEITPEAAQFGSHITNHFTVNGLVNSVASFSRPIAATQPEVERLARVGNFSQFRELLNIPDKTNLKAYSHATRTITTLTNVSLSNITSGGLYPYAQMTFTGADLTGMGNGLVTLFTESESNVPFRPPNIVQFDYFGIARNIGPPSRPYTLRGGELTRFAYNTAITGTLYLCNIFDRRYLFGAENFAAPGKPIGTFTCGVLEERCSLVFDATNFPVGVRPTLSQASNFFHFAVTSGTLTDAHIVLRDTP